MKIAVLNPLEGMVQLAQQQWVKGLERLGHQYKVYSLRTGKEDPLQRLSKLMDDLMEWRPDVILTDGALGFNVPQFYLDSRIQTIPVGAFWFDDPYRTLWLWKHHSAYLQAIRQKNVVHLIWDGYWREWMEKEYRVRTSPIHLAVDETQFIPMKRRREYHEHAVLIGTLISSENIDRIREGFPPLFQKMARSFADGYPRLPLGSNPYQLLDELIASLSEKERMAFEKVEQSQSDLCFKLAAFAWMSGKNEVRKRILKQALRVCPVLMCSGSLDGKYAREDEIRQMLEAVGNPHFTFQDTGGDHVDVPSLYAHGKIHLQVTDPQSVRGGIPFRVFQTTASRRPLLTDVKDELLECYEENVDLLTYRSEDEFGNKLTTSMQNQDLLDQVAKGGYQKTLRKHTWANRMKDVLDQLTHSHG